ncbi:MAG: P63C domain-containing protein [Defluviitaleaceae bacterium]|nr:P63C domain-containing protein [Defluviitaleaceae bacterium]
MDKKIEIISMESVLPDSPFAKYQGVLKLGNNDVDCYVSDTGQRLISMRGTVKAIANVDSGKLGNYIGVEAMKPFINADLALGELVELHIPGTQLKANCLESKKFLDICRAFVAALSKKALTTDRQREIAIQCSILLSACADIGLEALIDEATGYQYERREDELQIKLRLYIAEELRAWEKTFPDELWEEFGRLTNWSAPLSQRPKWWGKLVIELIYDTFDPDVAKWLRENKPEAGVHWHRQLTEHKGLKTLVSRCYEIVGMAKSCDTLQELREKVSYHYKGGFQQMSLPVELYEVEHKSDFNKALKKALDYKDT